MSYRCQTCRAKVPPKHPRIVWTVYRDAMNVHHGGLRREIAREVEVCPACLKALDAGDDFRQLEVAADRVRRLAAARPEVVTAVVHSRSGVLLQGRPAVLPGVPARIFRGPTNPTPAAEWLKNDSERTATRQQQLAQSIVPPIINKLIDDGVLPRPVDKNGVPIVPVVKPAPQPFPVAAQPKPVILFGLNPTPARRVTKRKK